MTVQNHIHLSDTLGGSPENSPDIKWKVMADGWKPAPRVIASVENSLTGKLLISSITSGGEPVQLSDYEYTIRVDEYWGMTLAERQTALLGLLGKRVYLVDNQHVDDDEDHTDYVKQMYFESIRDIKPINTLLSTLFITVQLRDDTI